MKTYLDLGINVDAVIDSCAKALKDENNQILWVSPGGNNGMAKCRQSVLSVRIIEAHDGIVTFQNLSRNLILALAAKIGEIEKIESEEFID